MKLNEFHYRRTSDDEESVIRGESYAKSLDKADYGKHLILVQDPRSKKNIIELLPEDVATSLLDKKFGPLKDDDDDNGGISEWEKQQAQRALEERVRKAAYVELRKTFPKKLENVDDLQRIVYCLCNGELDWLTDRLSEHWDWPEADTYEEQEDLLHKRLKEMTSEELILLIQDAAWDHAIGWWGVDNDSVDIIDHAKKAGVDVTKIRRRVKREAEKERAEA